MINLTPILIFGEYTPLFFSIIGITYIMTVGGLLKDLFAGSLINLLIIILTHAINVTFGMSLNLISLVLLEILLGVAWILSLIKT